MKVEIKKWGSAKGEDVFGIDVIAEDRDPEEIAILKRFFEGGAKVNVWGGSRIQFTFADMVKKPELNRKTRQRLDAVAGSVCRSPGLAVETLESFREDIREESREELITELSRTLGRMTENAVGSVIKGVLEGMVFFPIEPIRPRVSPMPPGDPSARVRPV